MTLAGHSMTSHSVRAVRKQNEVVSTEPRPREKPNKKRKRDINPIVAKILELSQDSVVSDSGTDDDTTLSKEY